MPSDASSRIAASGRNLRAALLGQLLTVTVNLISRRIFIRLLGSEYAGFSGLCGHLLNILSVLEPGFDASCIFMLYRPLATGDMILVSQICGYIERVYRKIALATLALGLLMLPVAVFMSRDSIDTLGVALIWIMSVFEMSVAYLFSHRRILPVSDQKGYVVTTYGYVFFIISQAARLLVLVRTESFVAYLATGIFVSLLEEMTLYRRVGKMYPFLPYASDGIPSGVRREILSETRSLIFNKIGGILCGSVDNMSVFLFLGLHSGATYSNYTMLMGICLSLVGVLCGAVAASIGNLGVCESRERMLRIYHTALFSASFTATLLSLSLFFTYPYIIKAWMGEGMVLGRLETALFCVSMFISAVRKPTAVFIDSFGLFEKERYKAITEAVIACTVTLVLSPKYGILGVLAGQICGAVTFSLWFEPYILIKYGFRESFVSFLRTVLGYLPSILLSSILSLALCTALPDNHPTLQEAILYRVLICLFSTVSVFGISFFDRRVLHDSARYAVRLIFR